MTWRDLERLVGSVHAWDFAEHLTAGGGFNPPALEGRMKNELVNLDLEHNHIRRTNDGRISVFDALKACGARSPRETWKRLSESYPHSVAKCDAIKLARSDGKLQAQPTPVTNAEGWRTILTVLPGVIGNKYRAAANELVTAFLERPAELAAAAIERTSNPDDLKKLEIRARSKRNAIALSGVVLGRGASRKTLARIHDINNVTITGSTSRERQTSTGLKLHRDAMTAAELSAMDLIQTVEAQQIVERDLKGDGAMIGVSLEVTRDAEPFLKKYLGIRKQPSGAMLQAEV